MVVCFNIINEERCHPHISKIRRRREGNAKLFGCWVLGRLQKGTSSDEVMLFLTCSYARRFLDVLRSSLIWLP